MSDALAATATDFVRGEKLPLSHPANQPVAKVFRRLLPMLLLCYFIAFIDRVNVGFAAAEMNRDLGFNATIYGLGAGIFFVGYFLFEVPSNLALHRIGARRWIARIMVTWGLIAGGMAFVTGEKSFYTLRFLLGAAEAGFFPGVIYYLTFWLPSAYRARLLGIFYVAIPVAVVIGSLISAPLLKLDGMGGLHGWQWLFIIQAVPAVVLGIAFWAFMQDGPADATWLTPAERTDLLARIEHDRVRNSPAVPESPLGALTHPGVVKLSCIYFCMNLAGVGLVLFLPQIVAGFGAGPNWSPVITGIPYLVAAVFLPFWGRFSDADGRRRLHAAFGAACVCLGLGLCVTVSNPVIMLALISVAAVGVYAFAPPFWALSSTLLTGSAAAAGLAAINSVGNLSGFLGPFLMGWIRDSTGSFSVGLLCIAIGPLCAALAMIAMSDRQFTR